MGAQRGTRRAIRGLLLTSAAVLLFDAGLAGGALAATPDGQPTANADDTGTTIGEVVIHAERRESELEKTALAVTKVDSAALAKGEVRSIADLQFMVPSLVYSQNGTAFTTLRGVGTSEPGSAVEAGVSTNIDGVYIGRVSTSELYFDLDSVEVLRGPQGTLYGRNATGGAINILSNSPTSQFAAGGKLTVGNFSQVRFEGYLSGPLGDNVEGRIAVLSDHRDSYLTNIAPGHGVKGDDAEGVRGSFRFTPTSRLKIDLIGDYLHYTSAGQVAQDLNGGISPISPAGTTTTTDPTKIDQTYPNVAIRQTYGVNLTAELDLGAAELKSITAYRNSLWKGQNGLSATTDPNTFIVFNEGSHQFTQELQLLSAPTSKANWVLGAYYFNEHVNGLYLPTFGISPAIPLYDAEFLDQIFTNTSYAVYGQITYPILPHLRLTAGARYTWDHKTGTGGGSESIFFLGAPPFLVIPDPVAVNKGWSAFTPKVGLDYDINDKTLVYGSVTRGYKAGNSNLSAGAPTVKPEFVTAYEIGLKSRSFDDRLQVNLDAYYYDYTNLQVFALQPGGASVIALFINAAKARIEGFDAEALARPVPNLTLSASYGYLDARFVQFLGAVDSFLGATTPAANNLRGNVLPRAPRDSLNLAAEYTIHGLPGDWRLTPRIEYSYRGRIFFSQFDHLSTSQKPYSLVNARLTLSDPSGRWSVAAFGKNLGDVHYLEQVNEGPGGGVPPGNVIAGFYAAPLTFGVELSAKY